MTERRHAVPHYKVSQDRVQKLAFTFTMAATFVVGAMCGACVAIGYMQ